MTDVSWNEVHDSRFTGLAYRQGEMQSQLPFLETQKSAIL